MELRYFGNPRVGVQPHRPLSLFLAERGTRPGGITLWFFAPVRARHPCRRARAIERIRANGMGGHARRAVRLGPRLPRLIEILIRERGDPILCFASLAGASCEGKARAALSRADIRPSDAGRRR